MYLCPHSTCADAAAVFGLSLSDLPRVVMHDTVRDRKYIQSRGITEKGKGKKRLQKGREEAEGSLQREVAGKSADGGVFSTSAIDDFITSTMLTIEEEMATASEL